MKQEYIEKLMKQKLGFVAGLFRELRNLDSQMMGDDSRNRMMQVGHMVLNHRIFKFHEKVSNDMEDLQIKDLDDLDALKTEIEDILMSRKIHQQLLHLDTHINVPAEN